MSAGYEEAIRIELAVFLKVNLRYLSVTVVSVSAVILSRPLLTGVLIFLETPSDLVRIPLERCRSYSPRTSQYQHLPGGDTDVFSNRTMFLSELDGQRELNRSSFRVVIRLKAL
jgi:hypothetical protein